MSEIIWTKQRVAEVAALCKNRTMMNKKYCGAYEAAVRNGWLDELFPDTVKQESWSSKTKCRNVAKKCKTKSEMQRRFTSAYLRSIKEGWIDEFFPDSKTKRGKRFWTYETCKEEAKKYTSLSKFAKGCDRAYRVSLNHGWLDEFFGSRKTQNDEYKNIDGKKDHYREVASKYPTPAKFKKSNPIIYKHCVIEGWLHEFYPKSDAADCKPVTIEECREIAAKYKSKHDFIDNEPIISMITMKYGIMDEIFTKYPGHKKIWTKEECAEIAKTCCSRKEFCARKASAFRAAEENGWLDDFFGSCNAATKEYYKGRAARYKRSSLFKKYAPAAYKYCLMRGWIDDFYPQEKVEESHKVRVISEKCIRAMILDYVEANGPQTKEAIKKVVLTVAGQNLGRREWGVSYWDNVSYGTSVFLPTRKDKRYLKPLRGFDAKNVKYEVTRS